MAQREFERCVANLPAAAQRGDSAGRLRAIGRSSLPAPGSGDGTRVPAGSPRRFAAALLHLQRRHGNRFVQQVVRGGASAPIIQTKVVVGPAGDRHEREADRVAGLVRSRATHVPHATGRASGVLHRAAADGGPVSAGVQQAIRAARGTGQPLPYRLRSSMERALGADFGGVRVHTDVQADQLNRLLQARAFTTGQDLFFRRSEYNPSSASGREVLAHELTHVVQQGSVTAGGGGMEVIQRLPWTINGKTYNTENDADQDQIKQAIQGMAPREAFKLLVLAARDAEVRISEQKGAKDLGEFINKTMKNTTPPAAAASATTTSAQPVPPPPVTPLPVTPPQVTQPVPLPVTPPQVTQPQVAQPVPQQSGPPPTLISPPPVTLPVTPRQTLTSPGGATGAMAVAAGGLPANNVATLAESDDSSAFVAADLSVPVVVNVEVAKQVDSYNLRDPDDRKRFIDRIRTTTARAYLYSYKRLFTAAVSDVPDPDSEFADVIEAFAATTKRFPELAPPAAEVQIQGYGSLSKWSQKDLPLFGSTLTKRVELASVPDLEASKKDHAIRNYKLTLTFRHNLKSDQATAVATHVANALHAVDVHGANLRQVVKVRDTNELYFLNIRIPRVEGSATSPNQIDVTVDAVKADKATARHRIDLSRLNRSLSDRILQKNEPLYINSVAGGDRKKLTLNIKDWRSNEIALLRRAIDLIPQPHQSMLSELKFVRVPAVPGSVGGTAAQFFPTDPPVICVSDAAMDPSYDEYVYDAKTDEVLPKSVRLIVHEIGHAVSTERWRKFALTYDETNAESVDKLKNLGGSKAISAKPIADLDNFITRGEYVTDYAASEMAGNDRETARSELFAEAYSLWLTDPDYMERHHKDLANWFATQKF
jgi:hypothetical protein